MYTSECNCLEIKFIVVIFGYQKHKKMKKLILSALSVLILGSIIFISCKSKNNSDAIAPTFKTEAQGGTGGNPNITNVTTTGITSTISLQQNSSISNVGDATWFSSGCTPGQICLTNVNNSTGTTIQICFSATPKAGTYQLVGSSSLLGPGKAFMTVTNPPSQDPGTSWYSWAGGNVTVTLGTPSGITAAFSNIPCYKAQATFLKVTVSGSVGCL